MIGEWSSLPAQSRLGSGALDVEAVLAEYNGPQILLIRRDGHSMLGIAADEEQGVVRWIFAPVTSVERRALALGALPTREVFITGQPVTVLDVTEDLCVAREWTGIDGSTLGENLPDAGALLPEHAQRFLREAFPSPEVAELSLATLESGEPAARGVGFRLLGEVLSVVQRFANAFAQATLQEPGDRGRQTADVIRRASLSFESAAPGSLQIGVSPEDRALFQRILGYLREAIEASSDGALASVADRNGPRVRARLQELLDLVRRNRVQLLARDGASSFFLNSGMAERIAGSLTPRVIEATHTRPAFGSFVAYDSGALTFEFLSDSDDVVYKGTVARGVAERNAAIAVGPGATYIVIITTTRWSRPGGKRDEYELIEVRKVDEVPEKADP